MYQDVIIAIPTATGLVFLVLLFGAAAGYVIVTKKIIAQDKRLKKSPLNGYEYPIRPNMDTNSLLSSAT